MPMMRCALPSGGRGWKWGDSGKCYPDKALAIKQMLAIEHRTGTTKADRLEAELERLEKEFSSPSSPTSGVASYSLEGQKGKRRVRGSRKMRRLEAMLAVVAKAVPTDVAANRAATSPYNSKRTPTERQRSSGNYAKGHLKIAGIDIAIENPAGTVRRQGWPVLSSHYGYIKRTEGADGDQVDVFVRIGTPADYGMAVHVIDQVDPETESFDEHKIMLGWEEANAARAAYLRNFTPGWNGLGAISTVSMSHFKRWLRDGDTRRPFLGQSVPSRRDGAREDSALTPSTIGGLL